MACINNLKKLLKKTAGSIAEGVITKIQVRTRSSPIFKFQQGFLRAIKIGLALYLILSVLIWFFLPIRLPKIMDMFCHWQQETVE